MQALFLAGQFAIVVSIANGLSLLAGDQLQRLKASSSPGKPISRTYKDAYRSRSIDLFPRLHAMALNMTPRHLRVPEQVPQEQPPEELTPKVFFLFMANKGLPHQQIWTRFAGHPEHMDHFRFLVHCQNETECRSSIYNTTLFHIVPTVPSKWCDDLVAPMDTLILTALSMGSGNRNDKFVFISDTTVPLKNFSFVYNQMVVQQHGNSTFCISPSDMWAWIRDSAGLLHMSVKHYQWVTLSREHATKVVRKRHVLRDLMDQLTPLHWKNTDWLAPFIAPFAKVLHQSPPAASGCLDEFLYFALIYGFVEDSGHDVNLPSFNKGPLQVSGDGIHDFQGVCDTFDHFGIGERFGDLVKALERDSDTELILEDEGRLHPATFTRMSKRSIVTLRDSTFLFARKVSANATLAGNGSLADAWYELILNVRNVSST